ncbi:hypothetical protein [Pontibacter akesuensis]|uniref:Uncharacterized protein n=1 Tax=Pontibacter akesuensis TaxID=388950 RepID=A0A1I7FIX8_9BACT|nr:hypothetical protein [Pontibacter akesuensis]GHA62013.1 hypothetical protein GCM10007389_13290 [Pontibacter akesuensis]SFU36026.1 hypothetical protein SAMN04487941_0229 [Pontibacter akesuensis]
MPQGTVIAIKPMGFVGDSQQLQSFDSGLDQQYAYSAAGNPEQSGNIVFIKVPPKGNTDRIFWFEDRVEMFALKDKVKFDIDEANTKSIKGAKNVVKLKSRVPALPGGLLPQLALLAAALLIIGVTLDKNR